ncbi:MAG TPA: hypothetical protein VEI97_03855 [bacterium]|nr:hypothetical protein [bacterium]
MPARSSSPQTSRSGSRQTSSRNNDTDNDQGTAARGGRGDTGRGGSQATTRGTQGTTRGAQGSTRGSGRGQAGTTGGRAGRGGGSPSTAELLQRQDSPVTFEREDLDGLQQLIEDAGGRIEDWACYGEPVDSIGASIRVGFEEVGELVERLVQELGYARPELQIYPVGFPRPNEVEVNLAFGRLK